MTATPTRPRATAVDERSAGLVEAFLTTPPPGGDTIDATLRHQQLLDALDRGEHRRLMAWPAGAPRAVAHLSASGTLSVAGDAAAGPAIAEHVAASGWRVLLGDARLADAILDAVSRGLLRRRPRAREQRLMVAREPADLAPPVGLRLAVPADRTVVTDLACRLHVEDRMGPPLSRAAREGVSERMRDSIARGATWVVDRGTIVAKVDVSLASSRRGAQIAGVYVEEAYRGGGLATRAVAVVARDLVTRAGMPGVTLHVRADNEAGRRAYERAGFVDVGAWTLALR